MTIYTEPAPCWVLVDVPDGHEPSPVASGSIPVGPTLPRSSRLGSGRRLDGPCSSAMCDSCGDLYCAPETGNPVHFRSVEDAVRTIDAAGWTTDETGRVLHCEECSTSDPLPDCPLAVHRFPAVADVPLF